MGPRTIKISGFLTLIQFALLQNALCTYITEPTTTNDGTNNAVLDDVNTFTELLEEIKQLHDIQAKQDHRITYLEDTVELQNDKIQEIEKVCITMKERGHENEIKEPRSNAQNDINRNTHESLESEVNFMTTENAYNGQPSIEQPVAISQYGTFRNKRATGNNVAFSVYLSQSISPLAAGQPIKCDALLLNDGNGYNKFTGVFTVPQTGVYLLTFQVGSFKLTHVKLVIDGINIADATTHGGEEEMAGNTVIVTATQGQSVWLEEYSNSDGQALGSSVFRLTTMSGVRLY